ncbi:MAG TPA: hypothetical protein VGP55_07355 [Chitinophagaceae bacterium]|nr:hypothetical protein [Chitinophagaceae bacterium]
MIIFSSDTKGIELINKKEILADGKLYDIVKTEMSDGKKLYYTLSDEEEDEYQLELTDWEKNNSQEKSMPGKTINLQLLKYFTVEKYQSFVLYCSIHFRCNTKTGSDSFLFKSPYKNIFSPPPDKLLS